MGARRVPGLLGGKGDMVMGDGGGFEGGVWDVIMICFTCFRMI